MAVSIKMDEPGFQYAVESVTYRGSVILPDEAMAKTTTTISFGDQESHSAESFAGPINKVRPSH